MFLARPRTFLLLALAASAVAGIFQNQLGLYSVDVLTRIGINIILAVSLNLINGHTGQFSLGHAGFMAVGGYTAAKFTLVFSPELGHAIPEPLQPLFFLVALVIGGLMAALVGLAVGVP